MRHRSLRRQLERITQAAEAAAVEDHPLLVLTEINRREDFILLTSANPYWSSEAWAGFLADGTFSSLSYPLPLTDGERDRLRRMTADDSLDMNSRRVAAFILEKDCGDVPTVKLNPDRVVVISFDPDFYGNREAIERGLEAQRQNAAAMGIENFDPSNLEHLDRLHRAELHQQSPPSES